MSEHTLDDLAARLGDNHWRIEFRGDELIATRDHTKTKLFIFGDILTSGVLIESDGDNVSLFPSDLKILSDYFGPDDDEAAIRQWQASAESALPPTAPVVTDEMVQRAVREIAYPIKVQLAFGGFYEATVGMAQVTRQALDAALRGADLAPEGARDAVRG